MTYRIEWVTVISAGTMGSNTALPPIVLLNVADHGCSTEKGQGNKMISELEPVLVVDLFPMERQSFNMFLAT